MREHHNFGLSCDNEFGDLSDEEPIGSANPLWNS